MWYVREGFGNEEDRQMTSSSSRRIPASFYLPFVIGLLLCLLGVIGILVAKMLPTIFPGSATPSLVTIIAVVSAAFFAAGGTMAWMAFRMGVKQWQRSHSGNTGGDSAG